MWETCIAVVGGMSGFLAKHEQHAPVMSWGTCCKRGRPCLALCAGVTALCVRNRKGRASVSCKIMGKIQFWNIGPAPGSCPYAQRTWIALEEKKLDYDIKLEDKANKSKEWDDLYHGIWTDPEATSRVPIVVDTDGTEVTESLICIEYLDAKYPDSGVRLLPANAAHAAKARLWAEMFVPNFTKRITILLSASDKEEVESANSEFSKGLVVLDRYLKKHSTSSGPFLLDDYSFAEAASAPFVFNTKLILSEFKKEDLLQLAKDAGADRLAEWMKAVLARPSTAATAASEKDRISLAEGRVARV